MPGSGSAHPEVCTLCMGHSGPWPEEATGSAQSTFPFSVEILEVFLPVLPLHSKGFPEKSVFGWLHRLPRNPSPSLRPARVWDHRLFSAILSERDWLKQAVDSVLPVLELVSPESQLLRCVTGTITAQVRLHTPGVPSGHSGPSRIPAPVSEGGCWPPGLPDRHIPCLFSAGF